MTHDPHSLSSLFTSIDVSGDSPMGLPPEQGSDVSAEIVGLLRELAAGQDRQNELLEDLAGQLGAAQRQRNAELGQWKEANPQLAERCRVAAESLARVQAQFLDNITQEICENIEMLVDGEFMLNEFVDRYGPRLAHLNGVLQVLSQLSSVSDPTNATQ